MKILIVDDSIDKISALTQAINNTSKNAIINTSGTISNALKMMIAGTYDLCIIDLFLPLRSDSQPQSNGGEFLVKEIYRRKNLNVPKYIIGFSQFDDSVESFSSIWKVIKYVPSSEIWVKSIEQIVNHILHIGFRDENEIKVPSVFVEGETDQFYLNKAFELFFNHYNDKIKIISQPNAGANWVASQIVIWGMQKFCFNGKYLKSIALLDSDEAGNKAKKDIYEKLKTPNDLKTFKVVQLIPKYNFELMNFYKQGCKVEVEIESLFPIEVLEHAEQNNWLEFRNPTFISNPTDWFQSQQTSMDYILSKGITTSKLLYTKKVKLEHKEKFCRYVLNHNDNNIWVNFKPLIEDLIKELEITPSLTVAASSQHSGEI